jgi:FdrA protein
MGFDAPAGAAPNDMVIALETVDDAARQAALGALTDALARRPDPGGEGGSATDVPPGTVTAAARRAAADLALVSTPGRVAAIDAADALESGLDVMIFSDNVSVAHEVALKDLAASRGRLVMGPDCGTAVVGGVGLGFANVVRPGPVGIVAASGTGAQHLMALLDGAGIGVAHCLGVGGRDLSASVAGRSTKAAVDRLAADPDVTTIVLVSKPPAAEVADAVTAHARRSGKDVVVGYLGAGQRDLTATAAAVAAAVGTPWQPPRSWGDPAVAVGGHLRGLYSGGTLCDEAMIVATAQLGEIWSNIPLDGQPTLPDDLGSRGHTFIDFGDDQLTVGRPHPMIDSTLRVERLERELADADCGVVLLDVVLGHGAHPNPAADLVPLLEQATKPVLVALVGTRDDPQGLDATAQALASAGAWVHASNAEAARAAVTLTAEGRP